MNVAHCGSPTQPPLVGDVWSSFAILGGYTWVISVKYSGVLPVGSVRALLKKSSGWRQVPTLQRQAQPGFTQPGV